MQLRGVCAAAIVLAALALAACGSSSKNSSASTLAEARTRPTTSIPNPSAGSRLEAAFIARADGICARAKAKLDANGQFPFSSFDPQRPDPKLLPKVGAYFAARQTIADAVPAELAELGTPRGAQEVWSKMLALAKEDRSIADRQIVAAKASDSSAFIATLEPISHAEMQFGRDASVAGFTASSPCNSIF